MTDAKQATTLVLAGTGKTGRRVAARLGARGVPVRIGSRKAEPSFDWHDETTWTPALAGADSVYLAYYPDAGFPGAAAVIGAFAHEAVRSGVHRLVLLADRGAAEAERAEQAVRDSGAEWTVVRAGFITQNFGEEFLADAIRHGVVALPAGDVAEPFLDADDIADVAVAALTQDGHTGRTHELTGPRLLTFAEAIHEIAAATGRTIRYQPVTSEQFESTMIDHGAPAEYSASLSGLLAEVFDGRRARTTNDVEQVLARPPKDLTDYVRETAPTGIWIA